MDELLGTRAQPERWSRSGSLCAEVGTGRAVISPRPFPRSGSLPPLRFGQFFLDAEHSCTIELPASLRSEAVRVHPGMSFGFPFGNSLRLRRNPHVSTNCGGGWKEPLSMVPQKHSDSVAPSATLTIPELEQSEAAVLHTLASVHSRRSYAYAIERFIAWYCSEPRLTFNRTVVVRYRSYLESLHLSAATINLHLSAIRRLADESAESGWLSPELAIGIRRVQGVKRLGRKSGNWLTRNQAQQLVNAASNTDLRGWRGSRSVFNQRNSLAAKRFTQDQRFC